MTGNLLVSHKKLKAVPFDARHFFFPRRAEPLSVPAERISVCVIIPTYMPSALTLRLVRDLTHWNPRSRIIVVDDCTPEHSESMRLFDEMASASKQVSILRTSENTLKAGALNFALRYIFEEEKLWPDAILTIDDDVIIEALTIRKLVAALMSDDSLGAVCSRSGVYNKNTNILTRLQGLEYLGFNAVRLADEGFYRGPLVMHGMLTAFRGAALHDVGGFTEGHLIEDYEVTTRLKASGWNVQSSLNARAWTVVPETLRHFWRQRTRWSYGGITVVTSATNKLSVFQDVLGHTIFLLTLALVCALVLLRGGSGVPPYIAQIVIGLSVVQFVLWYVFQLWLMRMYEERDAYDWLIRLALIPEFLFSYIMTFALIGSYLFHLFSKMAHPHSGRATFGGRCIQRFSEAFRTIGYTEKQWGVRRHI